MDDEFDKYLAKALNFLSFRPRSEKELKDYFIRKRVNLTLTNKIIAYLKEQKLINDLSFAIDWLESRARNKPRSKKMIELELLRKGVDKITIEEALKLSEVSTLSDIDLAQKIVSKYLKKLNFQNNDAAKKKLYGILGRKGFSFDTIKKVIDENLV